MKTTIISMILLGLFSTGIHAQCPTTPLVLSTQAEVTSFVTAFPNCTLLQGDLTISGGDISDLSGMPVDTIVGDLSFNQLELTSFAGMDQLERIEGTLSIVSNFELMNFSGLDHVNYIGGDLLLNTNFNTTYTGFEGLDTIKGSFRINGSSFAQNLTGFDHLVYLGSDLKITRSDFQTLNGLESLEQIFGDLELFDSRIELSLSGLDNVSKVGGDLNLQLLGGSSLDNLLGLNNLEEVAGDLSITQSSFIHLIGLERLKKIRGSLYIGFDYRLLDFTGLDSLRTIGMDFIFSYNNAQTSTIGLLQLDTIGGDLQIGGPFFDGEGMEMLADLDGFDHAIYIGGDLQISDCPSLSNCHVEAICTHLQLSNPAQINANSIGCNSPQDVLTACGTVSVQSSVSRNEPIIFPNPSRGIITIKFNENTFKNISLYTSVGQCINRFTIENQSSSIDLSEVKNGLYLLVFESSKHSFTKKLLVQQ